MSSDPIRSWAASGLFAEGQRYGLSFVVDSSENYPWYAVALNGTTAFGTQSYQEFGDFLRRFSGLTELLGWCANSCKPSEPTKTSEPTEPTEPTELIPDHDEV